MCNIRVSMPFVQGPYSNSNKGVTVPEMARREEIIDALAGVMGDPRFAKAAKEPRPKRAPTGYLLFCADLRPDVKAALEEQLAPGEKLKPSVTVTELAAQWKALTEEERAEWNAKATLIKELMVVRTSGDGSESE